MNFLKLNTDKTEILLIGTKSTLSKSPRLTLTIDNSYISPSEQVKSLLVILDNTPSYKSHNNNITRTAYFHLCIINRIRPSLTPHTTVILVHSLVASWLDDCNSLLFGLPQKILHKLITPIHSSHHTNPTADPLAPHHTPHSLQNPTAHLLYKANHNLAPVWTPSHCHAYPHTQILFLYRPLCFLSLPDYHGEQSIQPLCSSTLEFTPPWRPEHQFCLCAQIQNQNPSIQTCLAHLTPYTVELCSCILFVVCFCSILFLFCFLSLVFCIFNSFL